MKKFLRILALALALVSVLASLCACGSAIDRAVKNADEVIEAKKQGTQKNEYSSELIYYEDKDFYLIVYLDEIAAEEWYIACRNAQVDEEISDWYDEATNTYPVTVNEKVIGKVKM